MRFTVSSALLVLGLSSAAVINHEARADGDVDALIAVLKAVAPKSAAEPCTDASSAPGQCRTAAQAAAPLLASFEKYQITCSSEKAALISLIAFESGEFLYQRNVFPGTPGQGTRNMQMPNNNKLYAQSIPEIADQVSDDVAKNLDLLLSEEEYDWGSAAWYLTTQCSPEIRTQLQTGSQQGWENYISTCVQTSVTAERKAYWDKAMEALA